jgi:hypothetical protein
LKRTICCITTAVIVLFFGMGDSRGESGSGVVLVRTKLTHELSQAALVARDVDILHVYRDGRVDLAVTPSQLEWIRSTDAVVEVVERTELAAVAALDENLGLYHTYAEMETMLDSLAAANPSLCTIDTMGASIEGRVIRALKISDNAAADEDEPEVLIMGNHHAREIMSVEIPLLFAKYLLANYGTDTLVTRLVDTREIWIAPMINPDGHVYVELNHSTPWYSWWRKNRRDNGDGSYGVDVNRNYSYKWGYDNVGSSPTPSSEVYRGSAAFSEPETRAVRDFCATRHFTLALSYHSYGELILYPWGYASLYTGEHWLFSALGDSLARGNNYFAGNTAMGAIYITNGGSDDWFYGDTALKNRIYEFTVEVNTYVEGGFGPPESLIQPTFNKLLGLNLTVLRFADNPQRVIGPKKPTLAPITMLNPPNYELSWSPGAAPDPNPPVGYELRELLNLTGVADSVEAGDTLWVSDGFTLSNARVKAGFMSYYSGRGDNVHRTLEMRNIYPNWLGGTLSCWLWYSIEYGYDYAYLEVSTDDGLIWRTVPGNRTTNSNPYGNNRGNGITGNSGAWVNATFDVGQFIGCEEDCDILLRFTYITDEATSTEGIYVDLVDPTPRCDRDTVLASNDPETSFHRWPGEVGSFVYWVWAVDADGHASHRSNIVTHAVDALTPAGAPPVRSMLAQNVPNPFNPLTTIRFSVGTEERAGLETAPVRLALYDASGRRVALLVDREMVPGEYSALWDGRGDGGRTLASGIYFARLTVGGRAFAKKMVLLR